MNDSVEACEVVRKSDFAAALGVHKSRTSHFIKGGMPHRDDGFLDASVCLDWVEESTRVDPTKIAAARDQLLGPGSFPDLKRYSEKEIAAEGRSRKDFMTVAEAEEQARVQASRIREAFGLIPGRLANKLARQRNPAKVKALVKGEIDRVLHELADELGPAA